MADPNMTYHLDVKDAPLEDVLVDVFTQADRAFVVDDPLPDTITVHADDLGFRDAINLLLPTGYAAMEAEDGIYHIKRAA